MVFRRQRRAPLRSSTGIDSARNLNGGRPDFNRWDHRRTYAMVLKGMLWLLAPGYQRGRLRLSTYGL